MAKTKLKDGSIVYDTDYKDGYYPELPKGYSYNPETKQVIQSAESVAQQEKNNTLNDSLPVTKSNVTKNNATGYTADSRLASLTNQYLNQTPFSFDYENDPLYQNYLKSYTQQGQKAMNDTLAQVSARTGGLASTYATQAAQGTYNNYLQQAADKIPELYKLRYAEWQDQQNQLANQINMLTNQDATNYSRYRDTLSDDRYADETAYNRGRDTISDQRYADELEYNRGRDALSDQRYDDETLYNRGQDQLNWNYKYAQLNQQNALDRANYLASLGDYSGINSYYGLNISPLGTEYPTNYEEFNNMAGRYPGLTESGYNKAKRMGDTTLPDTYQEYLKQEYDTYAKKTLSNNTAAQTRESNIKTNYTELYDKGVEYMQNGSVNSALEYWYQNANSTEQFESLIDAADISDADLEKFKEKKGIKSNG